MKKYEFTATAVEWVETRKAIHPPGVRMFSGRGGWLDRFREWIWNKWSAPYYEPVHKIRRREIKRESLGRSISEAINAMRIRTSDVAHVIVSRKTAFYAECQTMDFASQFTMPFGYSRLSYYRHIPIIVLPWYDHDEVLIVPKDAMPAKA